jgi:hypothetical protein
VRNLVPPELAAETLRARLDAYRVAKHGAYLLRELLERRASVWTAGSGRVAEKPAPEQLTVWDRS